MDQFPAEIFLDIVYLVNGIIPANISIHSPQKNHSYHDAKKKCDDYGADESQEIKVRIL